MSPFPGPFSPFSHGACRELRNIGFAWLRTGPGRTLQRNRKTLNNIAVVQMRLT